HLTINNAIHNHKASKDISGHPTYCRLNIDEYYKVQQIYAASTIYNARNKIRHDNLQGHTPIQALFDKLSEGNFEHDFQYDQS
ncbi:3490_t:CDS:2, partial [Racocetra persica]